MTTNKEPEALVNNRLASDRLFSEEQRALFQTIAALIVPASAEYGVPGADDPVIFADCLKAAREAEPLLREALEYAQRELSDSQDGVSIAQVLEGKTAMAPLVSLVLQCYYRDDRVMQSLGMEARAPFPKGYSVPEGDWSLLEAVQRRGKIWRDT